MGTHEDLIRPADAATPPEHWRYTRHLAALATAAAAVSADAAASGAAPAGIAAEADAVAAVLRDPDPVMAESAVVTHLDRRATQLLADAAFPAWADAMAAALGDRVFAVRRLREWTLLRAIGRGETWTAAELTAASDWCQRTAARLLTASDALSLLADSARTRRVRNAAAQRLRRNPA
ncbi:hypothetical protein ACFVGY_02780 [Streptomyces sp. NPDC127106]|uniref:hypothetical protein n=1 Tax=Streptomyces sp. NPDC127106 TaxID=3345360 RepID=UPI003643D053